MNRLTVQTLVLCRGEEVILGVGQTADIFLFPDGLPEQRWGIRMDHFLMPSTTPLLKEWEEGLVLHLHRSGADRGVGEIVAADLTYLGTQSGFEVDVHSTVVYGQVDFQTRTRPVILEEKFNT